ncbi:YoaK family protein [Altererythrobacter sp. Root672]|uniref:YoaK family protein n=1 Tax=Altererythrobacter sp. Root672 TaxID=1736584 RepID=UPI0006F96CC8|nr:YoaK family protein [Altererythrobacter sp. Root672]KRA81530.1 hypothetical protein ASD76_13405 [Altererythrobacter sp. Root672]
MHRYDSSRRLLAYGIAGLAGFVDATGFLAADGYFVSFMSGNTTRLGVDIGTRVGSAVVPALLIVGFICGVTLGALVSENASRARKSAVLAVSSALIVTAAIGHALGSKLLFLGGSVTAMGAINNMFRKDGEVAVGVTYMTGALVRLGQGLAARLQRRPFDGAAASFALWGSLAVGAIGGALATETIPVWAPWIPVLASLALLGAALRLELRPV